MRARLLLLAVVGALAATLLHDASVPPDTQWSTRAALVSLRTYRATASPILTRMGVSCRFAPTCSRYASAAYAKYGFLRGTLLTVRRVARCGPWTPAGTRDEP
jgi:hypothetical protein